MDWHLIASVAACSELPLVSRLRLARFFAQLSNGEPVDMTLSSTPIQRINDVLKEHMVGLRVHYCTSLQSFLDEPPSCLIQLCARDSSASMHPLVIGFAEQHCVQFASSMPP